MMKSIFGGGYGAGSVVGVIVFGVCLILTGMVIYDQFRYNIGGYVRVEGIVISASVDGSSTATAGSSRSNVSYYPVIGYRYTVDGLSYIGNSRDSLLTTISILDRSVAEEVVARYPKGTEIDVWYDPDEPKTSTVNVEKKRIGSKLKTIFFFFIFGIISILTDRWAVKTRRERDSQTSNT